MSNLQNRLTIVIVCFNSGNVISSALGKLIDENCCSIIVVDNHSTDNSVDFLKDRFKNLTIIESSKNIGYGSAANLGFNTIETEYVLLLNPDVLLSADLLNQVFVNALSSNNRQVVFSPALDKKNYTKQGNQIVDYLIGAFLLIKYEPLKEIGFFDENFFLFYEEKDLELRFIQSGYDLILQSDLYVEHLKSASSGSSIEIHYLRNWHVAWSNLYYSYKHNLFNSKLSGYALVIKYAFKYCIYIGKKKVKYKARFFGAVSFLLGKSSFDDFGKGRHTP